MIKNFLQKEKFQHYFGMELENQNNKKDSLKIVFIIIHFNWFNE